MKFFLRNSFLCFAFTWFCCLVPAVVSAQLTSPDSPVSLSVSNVPVTVALDRLSVNCGVTFSYNPDQLKAEKAVTVNFTEKPFREVLAAILPPDKFGYKLSGNQVVLYKLKPDEPEEVPAAAEIPPGLKVQETAIYPDTVFITRTEVRNDTIIRTDTVMKHDTLYTLSAVTPEKPVTGDDNFSGKTSLREELTKDFTFEAGFSLTWLASSSTFSAETSYSDKLEDYRSAYSNSLLSGSVNIDLRLRYARFSLESGLSYTGFNETLSYNYMVTNGGYYRKDTLDIYYTLDESDTSWFYVLDSTYLPLDQKDYRYNTGIHHGFIELPLAFQYNQPVRRMLLYARAGIIASVHAGSNGWYILPDEDGVGDIAELKARAVVFSWLIGAGAMFPLNKNFKLNTGVIYRKQLQGIYLDFPIDQRFGAFGINCGIIYRF